MRALLKSLAYGAADAWTGGRGVARIISGETVRFPPRWSRYYPADYDAPKFAFLRTHCHPGETVIDIGAHIGLFSVTMAHLVGDRGKVISFEPTPFTRDVLRETIHMNHCDAIVEIRPEAVAGKNGVAAFHDTGDAVSNANSLVDARSGTRALTVPTIALDDFVEARGLVPRCLKIDVEGAELDLLAGASRTIDRVRPAIEIELHPRALVAAGASLVDAVRYFDAHGLAVFHEGQPVGPDWIASRQDAVDLQLLPRERAGRN